MNIETFNTRLINWYGTLPTWKKIVFGIGVAALLLLGVVFVFYKYFKENTTLVDSTKADSAHEKVLSATIKQNKATQKHLEEDLLLIKNEANKLVQERVKDSQKQAEIQEPSPTQKVSKKLTPF